MPQFKSPFPQPEQPQQQSYILPVDEPVIKMPRRQKQEQTVPSLPQYPPQIYEQQPREKPPQRQRVQHQVPKESLKPIWITLAIIFVILGAGIILTPTFSHLISSNSNTASNTDTGTGSSSTSTGTWTTTQTFTGNGAKNTNLFTVSNEWKLIWSCDPSSFSGGTYNLSVSVYRSDGSIVDAVALNTLCHAGNTGDSTYEYTGGTVYLSINSEAAWTIQIQELQ